MIRVFIKLLRRHTVEIDRSGIVALIKTPLQVPKAKAPMPTLDIIIICERLIDLDRCAFTYVGHGCVISYLVGININRLAVIGVEKTSTGKGPGVGSVLKLIVRNKKVAEIDGQGRESH
jgi:hypothetical protein